jgi:hypothetical protein
MLRTFLITYKLWITKRSFFKAHKSVWHLHYKDSAFEVNPGYTVNLSTNKLQRMLLQNKQSRYISKLMTSKIIHSKLLIKLMSPKIVDFIPTPTLWHSMSGPKKPPPLYFETEIPNETWKTPRPWNRSEISVSE